MASVKVALLDQLPLNLRPRMKFYSGFRLVVVGCSVVLLFLIFLCSNYPSKKPYLLRPTLNSFDSSSFTVLSALTSPPSVRNSTTPVVSDGVGDHQHFTNRSFSLEMTTGVQDALVHGQTLAVNTSRTPHNLQIVGNSSFHGGVNVANLGADKGKIRNSSQLADQGSTDSSRRCDIFDGKWVRNDTKPYYYQPGSCPHIDRDFDCFINGRPDHGFVKWGWQPNACTLPLLNATDFLERLRGKKLVFVGDSLNRNMWESLVCILRNSVRNKTRVYEISGRTEFKKKGVYAFRFEEYNCSVDFVGSPFLVRESSYSGRNGTFETLRLDLMDRSTQMYKDADILVFNTGHWWTHDKTSRGEDYYQEGEHVYPRLKVLKAYMKALTTWGRWVDANVDSNRTLVFFRGYSVTHFRGGQWNSGGQCHNETEPILEEKYLGKYPSKMRALEQVIKGMKTNVIYLNITRTTDYRKDGHPSIYRKAYLTDEERASAELSQDCSHWCLPGVPDTWNELLYASLLDHPTIISQQI